jgi:UDP-N-acetylglucosamine 2-epimerase (non-hydrolysing)
MRILSIFGTRPEAIKMAPVIKELEKHGDAIESIVCVTGQHRQMLDQVLSLFTIKPQIDLDLMEPNQTLASLTAKAMNTLTEVIVKIKPDVVLVQGDTATAMVAGLASFYQKIAVGHVEAGLRTYDKYNPFPEEINRRIISVLGTYNFAPTQTAVNALLSEGCSKENIFLTGNTVIDALFVAVKKDCDLGMNFLDPTKKLILVTAHRRESFGKPFQDICNGLKEIAVRNPTVEIVYPVHLNPNVREVVYQILSNQKRFHLIEPLEYGKLVHLMNRSHIVLTDSGGIQEEAPALGKPVLVLRNTTERPEAVESGTAKLIGTDTQTIIRETEKLLYDKNEYDRMSKAVSPYGDGRAAQRIVDILLSKHRNKL